MAMTNIFKLIARYIVKPVDPIGHGFVTVKKEQETKERRQKEEVTEENVKVIKWGEKFIPVKTEWSEDSHFVSWDPVESDQINPNISAELDEFDKEVIKENNLDKLNYKKAKPYVLSNLTYSEIAVILNASASWVQKLGRFIKKAEKAREKALSRA